MQLDLETDSVKLFIKSNKDKESTCNKSVESAIITMLSLWMNVMKHFTKASKTTVIAITKQKVW